VYSVSVDDMIRLVDTQYAADAVFEDWFFDKIYSFQHDCGAQRSK
jgi:hypothetical protein